MEIITRWTNPPRRCPYLPGLRERRETIFVAALDPDEYMLYLLAGWRRFGRMLYRPRCKGCAACRSLRVDVARFRPDRSQRRCRKANEGTIRLEISAPSVTREKLQLFDRFHAERSRTRGWSHHDPENAADYFANFVDNPFPAQEWRYSLGDALIGVGYVDELSGGLSAIYFASDPAHRDRSPGTWNVLSLLDRASALGLPYVYLGYYVEGCPSLSYKARFRPHQILEADGRWADGLDPS